MRTFFKMTLATVVAAVVLAMPTASEAGFVLKLSQTGFADKTVADNSGDDGLGGASNFGAILYNASYGDFLITVTTAISKPKTGSSAYPVISMSYNVFGGVSGKTLNISVTDTGFSLTPTQIKMAYALTNPPAGSASSLTGNYGATNGEFEASGPGNTIALSGVASSGVGSFSVPAGSPYSLTMKAAITTSAGFNSYQGTGTLAAVPEPASLAMWGLGALGMMIARKRRQAKLVA